MLKYKKRRLYIFFLSVFIPIVLLVSLFFVLKHYQKVDYKDLDLISKTRNIFSHSDKTLSKPDKKTATSSSSNDNATKNSEIYTVDSLNIDDPDVPLIKMNHTELYIDVDTNQLDKEVMIAKKVYDLPVNENERVLDSVLMNRPTKTKTIRLTVEFWLSPVNFKGYKRATNKIIIYGISDVKNANIELINSDLYLIINNTFFLLTFSNQFLELK